MVRFAVAICLFVFVTFAANVDNAPGLVKEGNSMSAGSAAQLQQALQKTPNDEAARLRLLGYFATVPNNETPAAIRHERAANIFWLIEHDPHCGLFEYVGGAWRIFTKGDALADPDAYAKAKEVWLRQIKAHPKDDRIKKYASIFVEFGDPQLSTDLLRELKLNRALGSHLANQLLGIVAEDYKTGEPSVVDESIRGSETETSISAELRASSDPQLLGGAGFWLATQGGILYTDGKTSWDYTPLAKELLEKARALDPVTLDWWAVSTALPARGERPPRVYRVGGAALKPMLRNQVTPEYPANARAHGIEGTVLIDAVVGLDGSIVRTVAKSGPPELIPSALAAVSQWKYKVSTTGGRPVFIITSLSIAYRLNGGVVI